MSDLRSFFRQALPGRIAEMEEALALLDGNSPHDDAAEAATLIRRIAHSLRGSGGTYGFPHVTEAAAAAEDAAADQLARRAGELLDVLRQAATGSDEDGPSEAATTASRPEPVPLRVLIVDDDPESRLLTGFVLRKAGHSVREAGDTAAALSAMDPAAPDVVLMDVMLGDEDGVEAASRIRAARPLAPAIVFLTAASQPEQRRRLEEFAPAGILTKPFDPDTFAAELGAVLDTKRERVRVRD